MPRRVTWLHLLAVLSQSIAAASPVLDRHQKPLQHDLDDSSSVSPEPELQSQSRNLHGRFLHITDFHPDEFYRAHTATDDDNSCHRGKGPAGQYGAETTDCDSPMTLVNATFEWIEANVRDDIDFVVWTGDTARHDRDEKHPRTRDQVLDMNRIIADKFVDTFSYGKGDLAIPVVPTFGNNDFLPHNIFYPGPNKWLHDYDRIWRKFIPSAQRHTFEFGGWFYVEVIPGKLAVFSLNTMYFFDRNAAVDGCAKPSEPGFEHMEWLRVQLQLMRETGMKAILIGHVPPARTKGKSNWDETCWQKYTLWLQQFRDVVTGSLYGHMNIDHFLLQDTKAVDLKLDTQDFDKDLSLADDDFSVLSKKDYLQDLREEWGDLPDSVRKVLSNDEDEDNDFFNDKDAAHFSKKKNKKKKKKKLKKIGGKYAERYQLSLVSPSVVPNYFPTLRVFEYNITGLENAKVWANVADKSELSIPSSDQSGVSGDSEDPTSQELRRRDLEKQSRGKEKKADVDKKSKKKKKKKKKPKDPNLTIPEDPEKKALPGPAYRPQALTFLGYTQYFVNLTYINSDVKGAETVDVSDSTDNFSDSSRATAPHPRDFKYEVEYSTFEDKIFRLKDLTVKSYLKLAYRIGQNTGKGSSVAREGDEDDDVEEEQELGYDNTSDNDADAFSEGEEEDGSDDDDGGDGDGDDELIEEGPEEQSEDDEAAIDKKKGKKGKKKKGKGKNNKEWLHFLSHAFVQTVPKKELKDL